MKIKLVLKILKILKSIFIPYSKIFAELLIYVPEYFEEVLGISELLFQDFGVKLELGYLSGIPRPSWDFKFSG